MAVTATSSQVRPQQRATGSRAAGSATKQSRRRNPAKKATPATAAGQPTAAPTEAPTEAKVLPTAGATARSVLTNVRWTARTVAYAVPQPKQLLYYGGIGVLAALGLLEWPVAAAVAAGVWVATRGGGGTQPPGSPEGETRATARPTAAAAR
jgi:hypothetical protein